jgi:carbon storage regulator
MLVLSRKNQQQIMIGEKIVVKVIGIERGRVKIGIEAPVDMPVLRSELVKIEKPEKPKAPGMLQE